MNKSPSLCRKKCTVTGTHTEQQARQNTANGLFDSVGSTTVGKWVSRGSLCCGLAPKNFNGKFNVLQSSFRCGPTQAQWSKVKGQMPKGQMANSMRSNPDVVLRAHTGPKSVTIMANSICSNPVRVLCGHTRPKKCHFNCKAHILGCITPAILGSSGGEESKRLHNRCYI